MDEGSVKCPIFHSFHPKISQQWLRGLSKVLDTEPTNQRHKRGWGGGRGQNTDLSPQPLDPESSALTTQPSNLSFHNHITIIIKSDQMQPRYIHTPAIISAHLPRHLSTWVQPERAQRAPFPAPAVHGRCGHVQTLCPPPSGTGHAPHQGQC